MFQRKTDGKPGSSSKFKESEKPDTKGSLIRDDSPVERNQLLETFFENTHLLIAIFDREYNFLWVNKAYAIADEKEPEFFPGKNHFELYPDDESEDLFREVVATGKPKFIYAKPFVYANNPERGITYWNWSLTPVTKNGKVSRVIMTLQNITSLKRAESELREMTQVFDAALAQANIGILTLDLFGNITRLSGSVFEKWEKSRKDMLGKNFVDIIPELGEKIAKSMEGESLKFIYSEYGHSLPVFYQCHFFPDKVQGSGIICLFTEIANLEELKDRLLGGNSVSGHAR